jgi:hypothetical protein
MWVTAVQSARFADERLASLSIESPTNLQTPDELGLLVALWCGRVHDQIEINGERCTFSFGFVAGEVVVDVSGGRIQNQGRLQIEARRLKISQKESDEAEKRGSFGAQVGFEIGKLFGASKPGIDLQGHLSRNLSKTEQKNGEYYRIFWRVADAGYNFWRVSGVGLNEDNILENKILGDQVLCHVAADSRERIEITVSFRCELIHLWVQRKATCKSPKDLRFSLDQDERNRIAVATRVLAKALKRGGLENTNAADQVAVLARQRLTVERKHGHR